MSHGRSIACMLSLLLACAGSTSSADSPPAPGPEPRATAEPAEPAEPTEPTEPTEAEGPRRSPRTTTKQLGDGHCEPEPNEGDPCGRDDSWCVLSWGSPGGHSTALWCRDGHWEREEEVNVP